MANVALHFLIGTGAALGIFLLLAYYAGDRSFSAPFGVVIVGIACATLAHFVSPWATPLIIGAYAVVGAIEARQYRSEARRPGL